ncbi:MAG: hypothetical protein ACYCZ7_02185 [Minisyncoccota bacterium]
MDGRTIIKRVLVGLGIAIVLGYAYFALGGFVRGPRIELRTPETGTATTTPWVVVAGRIIHASTLTLNDASTSPDLAGNFSESLLLAPGYNIMKIVATDRYGRSVEETIEMTLLAPITSGATTTEQASTTSAIY